MTALRSHGQFTRPGKVEEPRIPIAILKPLIERWAKENTISGDGSKQGLYHAGGTTGSGWVGNLSNLSGIGVRHIRNIMRGHYHNHRDNTIIYHVTFDTADKLTTAMECNQEWTSGSLAEFYGPLSVKGYERHLEGSHE